MGADSQKGGVNSSPHRTLLFTLTPPHPDPNHHHSSVAALGSALHPFFGSLLSCLSYHLSPPFPTSVLPSFLSLNGNHPPKVHFGLLLCDQAQ